MENYDARVSRLEDAFVMVIDIARRSEERLDKLEDSVKGDKAHIARLEHAFATVTEFAKAMDERLDSTDRRVDDLRGILREEVEALTGKIAALVDAQIRTETHLAELAETQAVSDRKLVDLAEAHLRTEAALAESQLRTEVALAESQLRMQDSLRELAQAQIRTAEAQALSDRKLAEGQALSDQKLAELAESQGHTDERLNALIHIVHRHVSGNGHGHSQG